jgi:hypothetical protein
MGMVSRTEEEKKEIAAYTALHGQRAAGEFYGCDRLTAGKYHKKYGTGAAHVDTGVQSSQKSSNSPVDFDALENENHKLRQEIQKLRNIIIDKMLED